MDDHELLRRYADDGSEDAFRQLVERHGGMVYSVALRQLGRSHQAEEVTHAVFAALAKKAGRLPSATILAGWLFRATRFAAAKLRRDEERRHRREQEAAMTMNTQANSEPETDWEQIVPCLDAELDALSDRDRSAVLLRFFEGRSFREVGEAMETSEDAAKMRVSRALNKLRQGFLKRGVALSVTALAGAFGSKAASATAPVPAGLVVSVAKSCVMNGAADELTVAILRKWVWWRMKPVVIGTGAVLVLATAGFIGWGLLNGPTIPAPNAPAWPAQR